MEEDGDEALSRLTLQDIQAGVDCGDEENFDMEMGHNDSSDAALAAPVAGACTPSTPFASPALQVGKPPASVESQTYYCKAASCDADAGGPMALGKSWFTGGHVYSIGVWCCGMTDVSVT